MTFDEFAKVQTELLKSVMAIRDTKGREYANSASRFGNFDRIAARYNIPNYVVGMTYMAKHLDSIETYIKSDLTSELSEPIEGRFIDIICYLTLVYGMMLETQQQREKNLEILKLRTQNDQRPNWHGEGV